MKTKLFILLCLFLISRDIKPCTLGVANGKATADGRPMLWKTRDYEVKTNILFYTRTDRINFISNITPEYGFDKSWFGVNEKGFAIANTFIQNYPDSKSGPENGEFMSLALRTCATVDDFKKLLDSTNFTQRKTKAVFGVIDSLGGAAIFEVSGNDYHMFDANDPLVAPDGIIIRTNFTISNGGKQGIERYERSGILINEMYRNGKLDVKNILQTQMRDMNYMPVSNSGNSPNAKDTIPKEYFDCRKNICTPFSISAVVICGIKQNEPASQTTLWAMLGNPFASIAVPYWAAGEVPSLASSVSECSLYGISRKIKNMIFDIQNKNYVNIPETIKLKNILFKIENTIYNNANTALDKWRKSAPGKNEMLSKERELADYAYSELLKVYNDLNAGKGKKAIDDRIIKLNNFPDKVIFAGVRNISISLPPDYFKENERYRVIYFFDGENAFSGGTDTPDKMSADYYRDKLLNEGLIYPAIFVSIHNNGKRYRELTPTAGLYINPGGKLEDFYNYIINILKPYVDSNFRTLKEPAYTGISGHSLGGLSAAWLAYKYPETFGMAGCMSPSFWWDNSILLKKMDTEPYAKTRPHFWIMSADLEYPGMWIDARTAAKNLIKNGWVEGRNIAYYHVYGGYHNIKACNNQMRDMLYFLLRKEEPKLININIKNILTSANEPLDIEAAGEYASLFLEMEYENGFRANLISPSFKIDDPEIADMKDNTTGFISPLKKGWTKISADYRNFKTSMAIKSYDINNYERLPFYKAKEKILVDGNYQ